MKYYKSEATSTNGTLSINKQTIIQRNVLSTKSDLGVAKDRLGEGGMFSQSPIGNISNEIRPDISLGEGIQYGDRTSNEELLEEAPELIEFDFASVLDTNKNRIKSVYKRYRDVVDLDEKILQEREASFVGFGFINGQSYTELNLNYSHGTSPLFVDDAARTKDSYFEEREKYFLYRGAKPDQVVVTEQTQRYLGFPNKKPPNIFNVEEHDETFDENNFQTIPTQGFGSTANQYRKVVSQNDINYFSIHSRMSGGMGYYSPTDASNYDTIGRYFKHNYNTFFKE